MSFTTENFRNGMKCIIASLKQGHQRDLCSMDEQMESPGKQTEEIANKSIHQTQNDVDTLVDQPELPTIINEDNLVESKNNSDALVNDVPPSSIQVEESMQNKISTVSDILSPFDQEQQSLAESREEEMHKLITIPETWQVQIVHGAVIALPATLKPSETQTEIYLKSGTHLFFQSGRISISNANFHNVDANEKPSPCIKGWYRKQYLGGFRDKRTQIENFHANAQTVTPQQLRDQVTGVIDFCLLTSVSANTSIFRGRYPRTIEILKPNS